MKEVLSCFRAYDVRGVYPDELDESIAYRIGRAFVLWTKTRKVYVGRDNRVSSPRLALALMNGVRAQGALVVDLGLISTPMAYLASRKGDTLMVTASHNPAQYNGIKVLRKGIKPVSMTSGLRQIQEIVLRGTFPEAKRGRLIRKSILQNYLKHVLWFAKDIKPLHVVIDCGNGMGGLTLSRLVQHLPVKVTWLHERSDGSFPNHVPNPVLAENIKDCQAAVRRAKADFGASFDGDMDRVAFVDNKGSAVPPDIILGLLAQHELRQHPKQPVVFDLRASRSVEDAIRAAGGMPVASKVGRTFLINKMRRAKALLGGELSGHYYWRQFYGVESADIAFIKLLGIVSKTYLHLADLVDPLLRYERSGELNFSVTDKARVMKALAAEFKDGRKSRLDGLTVTYPDAWFNARPSNTEPLIRVVIEADTKERLAELKRRVTRYLR